MTRNRPENVPEYAIPIPNEIRPGQQLWYWYDRDAKNHVYQLGETWTSAMLMTWYTDATKHQAEVRRWLRSVRNVLV